MDRRPWLWLSLLALFCGCRPAPQLPPTATPAEVFAAFDQALKAGDAQGACATVDFNVIAAKENSDWDSIPTGQRQRITKRMAEETAAGLQAMGYPTGGMTAGAPQVQGAQATIVATGGGKTLTLGLTQTAQGWRLTSGVPGMTTQSGMSADKG